MNLKRGVTFSVIIIAIVLMLIVISSASIIGSRAISTANYEEFKSEVQRVSSNLNEYYIQNNSLPVDGTNVSIDGLDTGLKNLIIQRDGNNPTLKVVNIDLIKDTTIKNGNKKNGSDRTKDVYIVCEETQNIYYMAGFKYNGNMYYTF